MEIISTSIIRGQPSMFVHLARLLTPDPVHRIISCLDPPEYYVYFHVEVVGDCLAHEAL